MIKAIVTDIEGTTSDIDFVHKVLFPYAAEHLPAYVETAQNTPAVATILDEVAQLSGASRDDVKTLISVLLQWIAEDRKVTPLKALQGLIWENGYKAGDFQAHIYDDTRDCLRQWHSKGLPLYIYSSGSIYAQKLFFGHSTAGNLLPLFSGHFDTTTGPKREASSYRTIIEALALPAEALLFLSDVVEELDAATEAGMQTVWVQRDDKATLQHKAPHISVRSFAEISL